MLHYRITVIAGAVITGSKRQRGVARSRIILKGRPLIKTYNGIRFLLSFCQMFYCFYLVILRALLLFCHIQRMILPEYFPRFAFPFPHGKCEGFAKGECYPCIFFHMLRDDKLRIRFRHTPLCEVNGHMFCKALIHALNTQIGFIVIGRPFQICITNIFQLIYSRDPRILFQFLLLVSVHGPDAHMPVPCFLLFKGNSVCLNGRDDGGDCCQHGCGQNNPHNGHKGAGPVLLQTFCRILKKDIFHHRITSSLTICPSSMLIIRFACSATFSSWVMTIKVW